jgi:segregation and condensation protein A
LFAAIAAGALAPKPVPIVMTDHVHAPQVSVAEHMAILAERLQRSGSATFRALVSECTLTIEVVARFLGLLELYQGGWVAFDQAEALTELRVRWTGPQRVDAETATTTGEAVVPSDKDVDEEYA